MPSRVFAAVLLFAVVGCQRPLLGDVAGEAARGAGDLDGSWRIWVDAPTGAEHFHMWSSFNADDFGIYSGWMGVMDRTIEESPLPNILGFNSVALWDGVEFVVDLPEPLAVTAGGNPLGSGAGVLDVALRGEVDGDLWCGVAEGVGDFDTLYMFEGQTVVGLNVTNSGGPTPRPADCD